MNKKLILTTIVTLVTVAMNAQLKVYSSPAGYVAIGSTSTTPNKPLDVIGSGGIQISQTTGSSNTNELLFKDNGQIRSHDDAHRIIFDRSNNILELREYGDILFSPGSGSSGIRTQTVTFKSGGNVGIGTTSPSSLLSVGGSGSSNYLCYFNNPSTAASATGLYATVATPTTSVNAYCINGTMTCGTGYAYGIKGSSYVSSAGSTGVALGVYGQAGNCTGGSNYGVAGILIGSNDGAGVFGSDRTNASLTATGGNYAGFFYGQIKTTNDAPLKPSTGSWTTYSDIRLKKDTAAFKDGLAVLRKVHPVTYKFTGTGGLPTIKTNIGIIAQEIQKIAPYCIGTSVLVVKQSETSNFGSDVVSSKPDTGGIGQSLVNVLTYNYDGLIYVLINSVKQLDSTVTVLQKQLAAKAGQRTTNTNPDSAIKALQKQVDDLIKNCCNKTNQNNSGSGKTLTVNTNTLSSSDAVLYPNVPNPFNVSTIIKCFIPDASKAASLLVFDMNGTLKKTIILNGKGEVNTVINAKELIAGMYFYTLIIDGNEIDTKKMILTEQ